LLEPLIVLRGKRLGQVLGARREIFSADQPGRKGMAIVGQVLEQTAEAEEVIRAGFVTQGGILLAEATEPTQPMRAAA